MAKWRKKPVVVDAWQFTKENYKEGVPRFLKHPHVVLWRQYAGTHIAGNITTLSGKVRAKEGDYIIKGVEGEFYPCDPGIFEKTYEEAK